MIAANFKSRLKTWLLLALLVSPGYECCLPTDPLLTRIERAGQLTVATRNSPATYFEGPRGMAGLEHDLVKLFAESLGVRVKFQSYRTFDDIFRALEWGRVDIAAAGLAITPERESRVRFSPPYQVTTQQVIYRIGSSRPRTVEDLIGRHIEVAAGTSHEQRLRVLAEVVPDLDWVAVEDADSEGLLVRVSDAETDLTVAWSNEVALNRRHYPELGVAFDLTEPLAIGWAYPHSEDSGLARAVEDFFQRIQADGRLSALLERYYGFVGQLSTVDAHRFRRHVRERLPQYRSMFIASAASLQLDWRLLAAVGYQESHWDPQAISPTGVRGIMMLTQVTASELGVSNRMDPEQSIAGGAAYVQQLIARVPADIPEPDRTWLALAGYNIGVGHLEDAIELTRQDGGNPNRWADVKTRLPLLQNRKWYSRTRHGYARGREAVDFVDGIRNYYDLLVRMANANEIPEFAEPKSAEVKDNDGES